MSEQIYSVEEIGLLWENLSSHHLAFTFEQKLQGYKCSKEILTIICCSNALGKHKLKLTLTRGGGGHSTRAENLSAHYFNIKEDYELANFWEDFTILDAIYDISVARNSVKPSTLKIMEKVITNIVNFQ